MNVLRQRIKSQILEWKNDSDRVIRQNMKKSVDAIVSVDSLLFQDLIKKSEHLLSQKLSDNTFLEKNSYPCIKELKFPKDKCTQIFLRNGWIWSRDYLYHPKKIWKWWVEDNDIKTSFIDIKNLNIWWKFHLNVKPENIQDVVSYLIENDYYHKYMNWWEPVDGKVFTIYVGSGQMSQREAYIMNKDIGNLLCKPKAKEEIEFQPWIVGRFCVVSFKDSNLCDVPRDKYTQYWNLGMSYLDIPWFIIVKNEIEVNKLKRSLEKLRWDHESVQKIQNIKDWLIKAKDKLSKSILVDWEKTFLELVKDFWTYFTW